MMARRASLASASMGRSTWVGFVEVGGVGVDVDDLDALGDGPAVGAVGLAEGVPYREHHVGLAVDLQGRAGGIAAAGIDAAAEREGGDFRGRCPCP